MKSISEQIRASRELLGLSQVELSKQSGVSLPMIQLIEAQRANPSFEVLSKLLSALGLELDLHPTQTAKERLVEAFGLVTGSGPTIHRLNRDRLKLWIQQIIQESTANPSQKHVSEHVPERIQESFEGLSLAIFEYYPTFFRTLCLPEPGRITGRQIKLKRIALQTLIEVMNS